MRNSRYASALLFSAAVTAAGLATLYNEAPPAPTHHQEASWTSSATPDTQQPKTLPHTQATTTTTVASPPSTTTTTSPPPAPSPPTASVTPTTSTGAGDAPSAYDQWTRVADCEEGSWDGSSGPAYPDSLGINAQNWQEYGGGADVSPAAQIAVAQALEAAAGTPGYVPDQGYCAPW